MAKWGKWGAVQRAQEIEKIATRKAGAKNIGIISGKGGVGKTTACSNLGVCLTTKFETNTLIIDANTLTSNLGIHLGIIHPQITLQDVLAKDTSLSHAIYIHSSGLKVIPSSVEFGTSIDAKRLKQNINEMSQEYEVVLVDSAPGLAVDACAVLDACDNLLVVTNPELPAVTDAIKTIDVAESYKKRILGIVVNKVKGRDYELTADEIEATCGYPVIGRIPYDENVPESIANKTPVVLYAPHSPASIALLNLASKISGKKQKTAAIEEYGPGVFKRLWYFLFG